MRARRCFKFAWKKNTQRYREASDDASDSLTNLTEFSKCAIVAKRRDLEHVYVRFKTVTKMTCQRASFVAIASRIDIAR